MSDLTYDNLIEEYIPIVEHDICEYLDTYFEDRAIFVDHASGLAFVRGNTLTSVASADYITDDNDDFSTAGFSAGMQVAIVGGSNEGIYAVASVSSGTLTMTTTGEFVAQDQDVFYRSPGRIRISRIKWPESLKPIAAKMIWHNVSKARPDGVMSERIDDYSVTYETAGVGGLRQYPNEIVNALSRFRTVRTH